MANLRYPYAHLPATVKLSSIKDREFVIADTQMLVMMSTTVKSSAMGQNFPESFAISNATVDELHEFILWIQLHSNKNLEVWYNRLGRSVTDYDLRGIRPLTAMRIVTFGVIACDLGVPCLRIIMEALWRQMMDGKSMGEVHGMLNISLSQTHKASLCRVLGWIHPDDEVNDANDDFGVQYVDENNENDPLLM